MDSTNLPVGPPSSDAGSSTSSRAPRSQRAMSTSGRSPLSYSESSDGDWEDASTSGDDDNISVTSSRTRRRKGRKFAIELRRTMRTRVSTYFGRFVTRIEFEAAKRAVKDMLRSNPNAVIMPPPEPSIWNEYTPPIMSPTAAPAPRNPFAAPQGPRLPAGYRLRGSAVPYGANRVRVSQEQNRVQMNRAPSPPVITPYHDSAFGVRPAGYVPPPMPRPLPMPPVFRPELFPPWPIEEVVHMFKNLMDRSSAGWTPDFGIGLPRDHIGTLKENDEQWVIDRHQAEKMRNEMQGQLLAGVMASRRALNKDVLNGDRNVIHFLAPIDFDERVRILDIRAGRAFWSRSLMYSHGNAKLYSADEYNKMDENELLKQGSQRIILPMDLNQAWRNLPERLNLIRIGDAIVHFRDKIELFRRCHKSVLPGGFLELQFLEPIVRNNHDGDVATNNPLNMLFQLLCEDAPEDLRDFSGSAVAKVALQEAGFEDIEISRSRAFIGPYASGTGYDRAAATLCQEALSRYAGHVGDMPLRVARGMMQREAAALHRHVGEMLSSPTCRFHMRFVCIVARKADRA